MAAGEFSLAHRLLVSTVSDFSGDGVMEQLLYRSLRAGWRIARRVPGVADLALAVLHRTGLAERVATVLAPVPPARFVEQEPAAIDYNSSTYGSLRPYTRPALEHFLSVEECYKRERTGHGRPEIAFVSALMGNYERPQRHEHLLGNADYLLVTDGSTPSEVGVTQVIQADYFSPDPVRAARFVKTHPYLYAPNARLIVWLDSNIVIRGDLRPLIDEFMQSGLPVGAIPHPLRSSIYEEAEECLQRKKDAPEDIRGQMARYRKAGYDTTRLVESNLMFLRMDIPDTRRFLSRWWSEIERGSRRDQLSLNFAADAVGLKYYPLTARPNSVRNHPDLALIHHNANPPAPPETTPEPWAETSFAEVRDERVARQRGKDASIVICVHNAPEVTAECLASVAAHRDARSHRIVLVDDGSAEETASLLRRFADCEPNALLLRHDDALGYTKAANAGLRASTGEFVLLLNSDTVVSADFVEKLADAAFTTPGVGIVGPLSNAASTQSIPDVRSFANQTAVNGLPSGMPPADMDRWCEERSPATFPRVPLVHGFCFGLTRQAIDAIGEFDEVSFPQGYGEENDYCFRAAAAGVGLAVATSTYVFHAKSQSYSSEQRAVIVNVSNERVKELHGKLRVRRSIISMQQNPVLVRIRNAAEELFKSLPA